MTELSKIFLQRRYSYTEIQELMNIYKLFITEHILGENYPYIEASAEEYGDPFWTFHYVGDDVLALTWTFWDIESIHYV